MGKKSLVISGGGSLGAFGGGVIQGLIEKNNKSYDLVVGTSTGSLLSPLSALEEMYRLKEAYTSVTQKDIFKTNPFNKKGKINIFNALYRIAIKGPIYKLFGKSILSLGDSVNLLKTIKKFFKEEDFLKIKNSDTEIVAAVVNMNTLSVEYKSSKDYEYDDFVEWLYISSCAPIYMSIVDKDGYQYTDGGIVEHIPIQHAIDSGATDIDVIIHRTNDDYTEKNLLENFLDTISATTSAMHKEISKDDILVSKLTSLNSNNSEININLYFTPYKLTDNSLIFNKNEMKFWWDLGYNGIKTERKKFVLNKKNMINEIK